MKVIGTAGHVDHGKSTLVRALTGIDPDRLKEEKAREMTIDLGFAWLNLPDGETAGIIDVPGHKDFVENMLAGVGAIDAVLFVIDANEGFMPQTREHLAIIDQLKINHGIIVLTKCDMIKDPEWFDLMIFDIREEFKGTCLSEAPIVKVSAITGEGLLDLINCISAEICQIPPARDIGKPRLSIDRVFSVQGFGTVVTGTLLDGRLLIGDEVFLSNGEKHGRVRGLQTHNKKVDEAFPGSRVAINIAALDANEIKRGDLLQKEASNGSLRIDAWVVLLQTASRSLKHNDTIKFFHLASEHTGRIRLLGKDEIFPGEEGFVQIDLATPLFAEISDRFILRFPSPPETIGGGQILQKNVSRKYKRFSSEVISTLTILHQGSFEERIEEISKGNNSFSSKDIEKATGFSQDEVMNKLTEMISSGQILNLLTNDEQSQPGTYITLMQFQNLSQQLMNKLEEYHKTFPLRSGISKEELKRNLNVERGVFEIIIGRLITEKVIKAANNRFSVDGFIVRLNPNQKKTIGQLNQKFDQAPYSPPDCRSLITDIGQELFDYLLSTGEFVRVNDDIVFRKTEYEKMLSFVKTTIREQGKLTASEFRDAFGNSRKYALAFLEFLDACGVTVREGDFRKLKDPNREQA